ncbi:hypothetical protein EV141_0570 [Microcella putealis]|uniref:Uncharacterized protein n=1 Tax=Microcella putealis TaxID=337005 RepID=A0A4Q7LZP1_9MICO|nr:hypothetical protein [Microcella putealis]RZS59349.1 hypothetical protein EV141_0570 [Microcella putealis]TQM19974.1 hypothetical protein BJ957_2107 [Microcella putealis]
MFADQPSPSLRQHALIACGEMCPSTAPGHAVSPIQNRLAAATPGKWRDAVIVSAHGAGWVELANLDGEATTIVWNHADLRGALPSGTPVAVHEVYGVLRVGTQTYSVLRAGAELAG